MAGYSDQQLLQVVQGRLQPGEQVWTAAYGEQGMPLWAVIVCMVLIATTLVVGLVVYVLWNLLATKNYVVALTDRRLMVVRVSGLEPKYAWDYPLPLQGHATLSLVGRGFNRGHLLEITGQQPFGVKFLNSSPTNSANAVNLGRWLQQGR